MTPPAEAWAAWIYRLLQVAIAAVILFAHFRHQSFLFETAWPPGLLPIVLKAASESDLYAWICTGLLVVGLIARNLVRNINFKVSKDGAEAHVEGDKP